MWFWLLDEDGNEIDSSSNSMNILRTLEELVDKFDISEYTVECDYVTEDHTSISKTLTVEEFVEKYMPL